MVFKRGFHSHLIEVTSFFQWRLFNQDSAFKSEMISYEVTWEEVWNISLNVFTSWCISSQPFHSLSSVWRKILTEMPFVLPSIFKVRLDRVRKGSYKVNQFPSERRSYDSLLLSTTDFLQAMWSKKHPGWYSDFTALIKDTSVGGGDLNLFCKHTHACTFSHCVIEETLTG